MRCSEKVLVPGDSVLVNHHEVVHEFSLFGCEKAVWVVFSIMLNPLQDEGKGLESPREDILEYF